MNEHTWIKQFHKLLPKELLIWKINDNFQGGVPDAYYAGPYGDVWVEYKYIHRLPKRPDSLIDEYPSVLQQKWLEKLNSCGKSTLVIMSSMHNCIILDHIDGQKITKKYWDSNHVNRSVAADRIIRLTLNEKADSDETEKAVDRGGGKITL